MLFEEYEVELLSGAPRRIGGIDISANFIFAFNSSLIILAAPYFFSLIFFILSKVWKTRSEQMKEYAWMTICIYGLAAVAFNLLEWTACFWAYLLYTTKVVMPWFSLNLTFFVLSLMGIIPILVLFGKYP